ncbi:MAG: secondary thiamine-phosphate synthase enzyme YjbQ [Thermodesulfovibrionia bacterium]|nr:secondary thiamine-phosphate synthase enzyme YjbQ [Thermodesulfovibrionia bacterium]
MIKNINVKTGSRIEFVNITSDLQKIVSESGVRNGVCHVYIPHTTAGVTINEGADPSVVEDIVSTLNKQVPHISGYLHAEGNSDAHIKTSLVGSSESIFIGGGKLLLGTWQAVFFCEFDGPRTRRYVARISAS